MDIKNEDTMVRQIEKNLSNNINDNLFLTGRIAENNRLPMKDKYDMEAEAKKTGAGDPDYPLVSYDYISTIPTTVSRAEYIRQAREACLRQLSNVQLYSRPYDVNYMDAAVEGTQQQQLEHKKAKVWKLFHDSTFPEGRPAEENSPQEIAAFRSLIVRMVCAIVLFLAVFLIDKFEFKLGNITHTMIREYVTANDTFQGLEDIFVTWIK